MCLLHPQASYLSLLLDVPSVGWRPRSPLGQATAKFLVASGFCPSLGVCFAEPSALAGRPLVPFRETVLHAAADAHSTIYVCIAGRRDCRGLSRMLDSQAYYEGEARVAYEARI